MFSTHPEMIPGMVHSVSGWMQGVQVKLWDPLRTRAIPERITGVFTTRRYTNPHLPYLTLPSNGNNLSPRCVLVPHVTMSLACSCDWCQTPVWHWSDRHSQCMYVCLCICVRVVKSRCLRLWTEPSTDKDCVQDILISLSEHNER